MPHWPNVASSEVYMHSDTPFWQQDMRACRPNFNSYPTTYLIVFSFIHLVLSLFIAFLSYGWHEIKVRYDDVCKDYSVCNVQFSTTYYFKPPINVYYELYNFSQNHFQFRQSRDFSQLSGAFVTNPSECSPRAYDANTSLFLAPCGLRALYAWRDEYSFPSKWNYTKNNLAWDGEIGELYKPLNNKYTDQQRWMKRVPGYESETVSDKFAIWMRTAPSSHFSKLYAKVLTEITPGKHNVTIKKMFPSDLYNGKRYIVFTVQSSAGGRNLTLIGINALASFVYIICAFISSLINITVIKDPSAFTQHINSAFKR